MAEAPLPESAVARVYDGGVPADLGEPWGDAALAPFRAALRAKAEEATRVREEFVGFCEASGVPAPAVDDLALALAEALDNVIEHAYAERPGGVLLVEAAVEGDGGVRLLVRDRGPEFDPTAVPGPAPVPHQEASFGGFGLKLVRGLVDEVRYERRNGENRLVLFKRPAGPDRS